MRVSGFRSTETARAHEIRARCEKATKGPWDVVNGYNVTGGFAEMSWYGRGSLFIAAPDRSSPRHDLLSKSAVNADFIAHAREDVPWLLDQLRAAQESLAHWQHCHGVTADRLAAAEAALQARASSGATTHEATLRRLAKEATNGWACYARTHREHDEITRLHREIDAVPAPPPDAPTRG